MSRRFYEALGDDIANELVDWFNVLGLTYRTALRELNDLNWVLKGPPQVASPVIEFFRLRTTGQLPYPCIVSRSTDLNRGGR